MGKAKTKRSKAVFLFLADWEEENEWSKELGLLEREPAHTFISIMYLEKKAKNGVGSQ